jgi:hypothetical protein
MTNYVPPSRCSRCVPIQTTTVDSSHGWSVDLAHETTCPNREDHK